MLHFLSVLIILLVHGSVGIAAPLTYRNSLVSWCYQQQKFILSYIYYKLYVVGHLSNQIASCPGC
jgi:hypothetical protein